MQRPAHAAILLAPFTVTSGEASAHALAQRYDLPLPLGYFLGGSGAAVAVTFIIAAIFLRKVVKSKPTHREAFLWLKLPGLVVAVLQGCSVVCFALLVSAGLFGNQDTFKNLTPVAVWVIWWVGFGFLSAFVCNLWPIVNPWSTVFGLAQRLVGDRLKVLSPGLRYPHWLGVWPACAFFLLFAWSELVAPARDVPRNIALGIVGYSLLTWLGCALFGRHCWIRNGEAFAIVFGLFGRFAPLVIHEKDGWQIGLRPFATGLIAEKPLSLSMCAFTLLVLGTVTVDGLMETPQWISVLNLVLDGGTVDEHPTLYILMQTGLLIGGPITLAAVYVFTASIMARSGRAKLRHIAGLFVLSLVPIAIAYHLAHYLTLFAIAGQFMIPLVSDPFGQGWDLFGTTLYRIDIGLIDAKTVWYTSGCAIVVGHMIAVWVGHVTAATSIADPRTAMRSQHPMLVLMVSYTVLSLWILAQPIIEPSGK
jgi:hypothetical protein